MPIQLDTPQEEQAALRDRILELKKDLNAVIVAHNYQRPEVQDIADFVGDSLELSRRCVDVEADTIVFCGVDFMAESAKVLNPEKLVLLSEGRANCPMAAMIDRQDLLEWKGRYPRAAVVSYINTSAEVKAESDICCTSANGVQVVESVEADEVLFVPDQHLGNYIASKTSKRMVMYPGYCVTHRRLKPEHIALAKQSHPDSPVLVHPECVAEAVEHADAVLSTSQMARYVRESPAKSFLIGTEMGLVYRMQKENPDKTFYLLATGLVCPTMKRTTLRTIVQTMEQRQNEITVPEDIRVRAKRALDRMLAVSPPASVVAGAPSGR